jgi:hypothetical protein
MAPERTTKPVEAIDVETGTETAVETAEEVVQAMEEEVIFEKQDKTSSIFANSTPRDVTWSHVSMKLLEKNGGDEVKKYILKVCLLNIRKSNGSFI